jgi:hypothetical protein
MLVADQCRPRESNGAALVTLGKGQRPRRQPFNSSAAMGCWFTALPSRRLCSARPVSRDRAAFFLSTVRALVGNVKKDTTGGSLPIVLQIACREQINVLRTGRWTLW